MAPGWSRGEEQLCALRALNICDGQVVEDPDARLRVCMCAQERIEMSNGQLHTAARLRQLRTLYEHLLDGPLDALAEAKLAVLESELTAR